MDAQSTLIAPFTTGGLSVMPSSLPDTFIPRLSAANDTAGASGTSFSDLFTGYTLGKVRGKTKAKLSRSLTIENTKVKIEISVELGNALVYLISVKWPSARNLRGLLNLQVVIPPDDDEGVKTSAFAEGFPSTRFAADFAIGPQNFVQKEAERTFADKVRDALKVTSDRWLAGLVAKDETWGSDPIVEGVQVHVNRLLLNDLADAWK